jgi:hypothetical protein
MLCKRSKLRSVPAWKYFDPRAAKLAILGLTFWPLDLASAEKIGSGAIMRISEGGPMRFLFGVIVGVLLTVGTAYVFDATRKTDASAGASERQMVNWDVVQTELKNLAGDIQDGWTRLTGRKEG